MFHPYARYLLAGFAGIMLFIFISFWSMGYIGAAISCLLITPLKLP